MRTVILCKQLLLDGMGANSPRYQHYAFSTGMAQQPIKKGERTNVVTVRFAESDAEMVRIRAKEEGLSMSAFIRQSAMACANAAKIDQIRKEMQIAANLAENIRSVMSNVNQLEE